MRISFRWLITLIIRLVSLIRTSIIRPIIFEYVKDKSSLSAKRPIFEYTRSIKRRSNRNYRK
jgi:hypothetical protein